MPRHKAGGQKNHNPTQRTTTPTNHKALVNHAMHNLPNGRIFTVGGVKYVKRNGKAVKVTG